jgi:hypothetical protein
MPGLRGRGRRIDVAAAEQAMRKRWLEPPRVAAAA